MLLAGRYRLESRIAAGAVGEVWRAQDQVLGRPVAVKLLQQGYAGHPQTLARFRAEARHAGSLTHPGIAQVYDYGEAGPAGVPYLVLELVDGPSLAGVLAAGPVDPATAMDVVAQVAAGLSAAHAADLVHRDVKPANLLMGRDGLVKITDFGIAHAAGSAPLTQAGTLVGTPAYLAPERAAGEPATPASDLYSLGIVAYECLTGAPPFRGTPLEIAAASRNQPLPPLPAAVPTPVTALVTDLTARAPAARPGHAAEVAAQAGRLRDAMNGGLPGGPAGQPDVRSRAYAGGHTAVLLEPQTPTELLERPSGPEDGWPPAGRQAAGRRPGRHGWVAALAVAVLVALAGWLVAREAGGPARPPAAATSPRASPGPGTHGPAMVTVNAAALLGRPAETVRQQLAGLGLRPRVVWVAAGRRPPGIAVSMQPSGRVAEGSIVTVTAAAAPADYRHHHGRGHEKGNGGGHGQGGGD